MAVIYVLIPLAMLLAAAAFGAFLWAARRGQFDDLDTPPHRAVFDDDDPVTPAPPPASDPRDGDERDEAGGA